MESQFPGNSQKGSKASGSKKIEKVVIGEVVRRKKPLGKRLKETFTGEDTRNVGSYVLFDVAVPAFKDLVADVIIGGVERKLFGESRSANRRGYRPNSGSIFGNATYNAYNRYAQGSSIRPDPRQGSTVQPNRGRVPHSSYDEIILQTRAEATEVLDQMIAVIDQYDVVTVSDLFEMVGWTGEPTDLKWGWIDLRGADIQRLNDGYLLNLPRPAPIDD